MSDFEITLEKTGPYELSYSYNMAGPYSGSDKVCLFVYNREMSYSASNPITEPRGGGKFVVQRLGYYNVRIIRGADTIHALARSEPVLIGPSVDLSAERVGENVVVTYSVKKDPLYTSPSGSWWIGAYTAGSLSNRQYIASKYCKPNESNGEVLFNAKSDLKPTKGSRTFDFRFFFETSAPYGYSGATTYEVMSQDSLSFIPPETNGRDGRVVLTIYWERHDDTVGKGDWIGLYSLSPRAECVAEKYLTEGVIMGEGSGSICFDLTEWLKTVDAAQIPRFEACYFTHYMPLVNTKVEEMTINFPMKMH